jgi:hypothetical protein
LYEPMIMTTPGGVDDCGLPRSLHRMQNDRIPDERGIPVSPTAEPNGSDMATYGGSEKPNADN